MKVLLDTNLLLRAAEPAHPQHPWATHAIGQLLRRNDQPCIVPQVVYEFWVAATRPTSQNGLGFTTAAVAAEVERIENVCVMLEDQTGLYAAWKQLVAAHDVKGKPAHDARLVAAMGLHGVTTVATFNESDFLRFPNVTVLTPAAILSPP